MRTIILVFLLTLSFCSKGQTINSFDKIQFDKIVMYDFDPRGEKGGSIVEQNEQLTKSIKKKVVLDKATIATLNAKLNNKKSFNWGTADCFDPHLGFVYYKAEKIVGYINICLSCNRLYASFKLKAQEGDKAGNNNAVGMSKSFRFFLNKQLRKYNFSNQATTGSHFDE